ncbi:alpha/beta hydrolase family protein [Blautia sp. HCP3S3_H10_1]|uniref:alpha/beta hydrolase family protein n=1 Tax=unclassified Blautia TaxID=2648079 RepID=UPI003F93EB64|nr:prolyl oligopeptidase family serine peptidase [Clostridia bacterium]
MKKKVLMILLTTVLIFGYTTLPAMAESQEAENTESADAEAESDPSLEEGYTEENDGCTSVVAWAKNGENDIYGKFYYPADYEEGKTYPVVIMSHGGSVTHEFYEKAQWTNYVTGLGYICYAYDFCGGSDQSKSSMTTEEMSCLTEKSDLNAVLDFVESQRFCDQQQIFLMGQSFGGFVTGITAPERQDEIVGVMLLYPALSVVDVLHEQYPTKEDLPTGEEESENFGTKVGAQYYTDMYDIDVMGTLGQYEGDVLIIHGVNDQTIPYTYSVQAIEEAYQNSSSELVLIGGKQSVHAFEVFNEDGRAEAQEAVGDYLSRHKNSAGE